jgi:hypothetical protein
MRCRSAGDEARSMRGICLIYRKAGNVNPLGRFSTSAALCHWPCSCYPNHSLGQVQDCE